jgi:hypothetical protein
VSNILKEQVDVEWSILADAIRRKWDRIFDECAEVLPCKCGEMAREKKKQAVDKLKEVEKC